MQGSEGSRAWLHALKSLGLEARPTIHDLRHCWKTNAMRSGVHPLIADAIVGHGDRKKTVQSLYLSISDADLLGAIDRMKFDVGETEIFVKISSSKSEGGPLGARQLSDSTAH